MMGRFRGELKPEAGGARRFCEALQQKGILAKETHEDVIRFAPPLVIDKDTIDWDGFSMAPLYSTLIRMKKENPALWNGAWGGERITLKTGHRKEVYALLRVKDNNRVLALFNLTPKPVSFSLDNKEAYGEYTDVFSQAATRIAKETTITLRPWAYQVLARN